MKSPFPKETYQKNAEIYKLIANPTRLEILNILKVGEASVEELTRVLKIRKANVSQHLAILRHSRIVIRRKNGLDAYYSIVDKRIVDPCKTFHDLRKVGVI